MNTQQKLDEETLIQESARDGIMVEHDCKGDSCETCVRWFEARDFWVREEIREQHEIQRQIKLDEIK